MSNRFTFSTIKEIWQSVGHFKNRAILLSVVIVASSVTEGFGYALIFPILDHIAESESSDIWNRLSDQYLSSFVSDDHILLVFCLAFAAMILLRSLLNLTRIWLTSKFAEEIRAYWMSQVKEYYLYAPYSFLISKKQGYLLNNLLNEPKQAASALKSFIEFSGRIILVAVLFGFLLVSDWQITLALTGFCVLILALSSPISERYGSRFGKERLKLGQEITTIAAEDLNGSRQVKIFELEQFFLKRFSKTLHRYIQIIVRNAVIVAIPPQIGEVFLILSLIGGILVMKYVLGTDLKPLVPTLATFALISQRLGKVLTEIIAQRINMMSSHPSLRLVHELSQEERKREKNEIGTPISELSQGIRFEHLDFSYEPGVSVVRNLDFEFKKGSLSVILGSSGSGKSTLLDLLLGLYQPTSGEIRVDDHNLRELKPSDWRKMIGFVSQDTFVFHETIMENIRLGHLGATDQEVQYACRAAGAHDFIQSLSNGYQTVVGERGSKLSGGQRQRLALARALVRNPQILVLDEFTSALDEKTEAQIVETIKDFRGDKTIIIVTHRLGLSEIADQVLNLEKMENPGALSSTESPTPPL